MSTIIKPKRATQEEIAASTKVLSKDEILLAIPNEGDHSGKLKLYRGDGITPANELPVGIDGELGDDLKISAFEESTAEENQELEAGASLSRLFGNIKRKFTQVQNETSNKVSSNGDISNTVIGSVDTITADFPEPATGESTKTYLGKVKKFIADFNSFKNGIITLGRLANNADTTAEGFALDARMGKTLGDRVAQLNSDLGEVNSNLTSQGYLGYVKQIRDIDYNDLRPTNYTDGFYAVASNRNCPFNEGWTYVILLSFAESICVQIAIDSNAIVSGIKTRTLVADNWGDWQSYVKSTDFTVKTLDVTCQAGRTVTTELNAYDHIVTGMASMSVNDYITRYLLVSNGLIINSTAAHTVRVYYLNIPK